MPRSGSTRIRRRLAKRPVSPSSVRCSITRKLSLSARPGSTTTTAGDAKEEQRRLFSAQLALAAELDLPIVVHTRSANDDTEAMLRAHDGTVVMHCFSEPELLAAGVERGWYFSFAGNATYPKAEALREAAAAVPADRILAETDSPYLAPQPVRGRPNEPAHVVHTVAALAEARDEDASELAARIDANAAAAFRLP